MAIGNPITLTSNVASKTISAIATAGQTLFTVTGGYRINQLAVFRNGVRLLDGRDYEARNGSTVTLLSAATVGDALEFQVFDDFRVADAIVSAESEQTIQGNLNVAGILTATDLSVTDLSLRHLEATGISTVSNTTQSTTTTSGALIVSGGLGVAKNLFVGGSMNVAGTLTYEDVTNSETAGITTTGGLVVTGLGATFGSISTHFSNIEFGAAGVGGTITPLGHAEFAGVVTATSFSGDGSALTGVASTENINTSTLAQFTGPVGIADSIFHIGDSNTAIRFPAADTFTVETAGSERIRVTGANLLSGTNAARSNFNDSTIETRLQIEAAGDNDSAALSIISNAGTTNSDKRSGLLVLGRTRGTSNGATTVVVEDDQVGMIEFKGMDGTSFTTAASIKAQVDGSVGTDDMPGRLVFSTTADGAAIPTEALRIDSSQRILKGHTASEALNYTGAIQVQGTNSSTSAITIKSNQNDSGGPALVLGKSRGSLGGATVVQSGDQLGSIYFNGADGTDTASIGAEIQGAVDGTPGSNDMPGRLAFLTTADGASSATERMRISSAGQVRIGTESESDRTSHTLQVSATGSDSLLSLQNFSNSDGSEMDIAFYALNTNNASVKFAQIVARADETQANSSQQGSLKFSVNMAASMTDVAKFNTNGHFVPASDNTYDLGGTSERWRNIYSADLQLSNEGMGNDVDGTWGQYTIQEGENDLFLLNRRNGKTYKFVLEEVN